MRPVLSARNMPWLMVENRPNIERAAKARMLSASWGKAWLASRGGKGGATLIQNLQSCRRGPAEPSYSYGRKPARQMPKPEFLRHLLCWRSHSRATVAQQRFAVCAHKKAALRPLREKRVEAYRPMPAMPALAICASSVDLTPLTPTAPRHSPSFITGTPPSSMPSMTGALRKAVRPPLIMSS